jgi:hypothetical protein
VFFLPCDGAKLEYRQLNQRLKTAVFAESKGLIRIAKNRRYQQLFLNSTFNSATQTPTACQPG